MRYEHFSCSISVELKTSVMYSHYIYILLATLSAFFVNFSSGQESLIVTTNSGKILGKTSKDRKNNTFYSFQSIPFAKPPVGSLRFKDPEPAEPWKNILDGTVPPPKCAQEIQGTKNTTGQEDCLYLNIFTPQLSNVTLLPVMVFIHGGAFRTGSSGEFGPEFLLPEKVIVATINYRVGFLGFLNFANHSINVPGNAALKDQVLALKWIKNNIKYFGGNSNNITIFGESAGSASVHLHVLSPMSKGLFHKAIAQSGCALNLWTQGKKDNSRTLANALNIKATNDATLLAELQRVPVEKIVEGQITITSEANVSTQWDASLVVETQTNSPAFLPNNSINIIRSGNFNTVPIMLGYNSDEGLLNQVSSLIASGEYFIIKNYQEHLPYILQNKTDKLKEIAAKVEKFYNSQNATFLQPSINFISDTTFYYRIYHSVLEHSKIGKAPVYFYRFSADTKLNYLKRLVKKLEDYPGACHADDLGYLFKLEKTPAIASGSIEEVTLERMVRLWTNFAKFGNPTPKQDSLLQNHIWRPFFLNDQYIFEIGNNLNVSADPDIGRIKFWDDIYKTYT